MSELTFEEVEKDRQASARDLDALAKVIAGMEAFILNPCGEDRRFFQIDLMKWRAMAMEADRLHEKILKKHAELKTKPPTVGDKDV